MSYWVYIGVIAVAASITAMINILLSRFTRNKKMIWFAIVTLVPLLGPLVYFVQRNAIEVSSEGE